MALHGYFYSLTAFSLLKTSTLLKSLNRNKNTLDIFDLLILLSGPFIEKL